MQFDPAIGAEIVRLISDGKSLVEICAQPGFPHRQRVHEWIAENVDGFADRYARARETQAEHYADEIIAIADGVARNATSEEVQAARLQVDSRKWVASKLAPKQYGERQEIVGAGGKDLIPPHARESDGLSLALMLAVKSLPKPPDEQG